MMRNRRTDFLDRGGGNNSNDNDVIASPPTTKNSNEEKSAGTGVSLSSVSPPRRKTRRIRLLVAVIGTTALTVWRLSRNKFAPVRKGYVRLHYWIAPKLFRLSTLAFSTADLSEGGIYKRLAAAENFTFPLKTGTLGGCVWDVGANNGVWHSNSHYLIHAKQFFAWLYEPDAATFLQLRETYQDTKAAAHNNHPSSRVRLHNFAVGGRTETRTLRLFPMGFENTIRAAKSNQHDSIEFSYDIAVQDAALLCRQQQMALANGLCVTTPHGDQDHRQFRNYTVLSIDAEGSDWEVFTAAHRDGCRWDLVILEGEGIPSKLKELGYEFVLHVAYNFVYARRDRSSTLPAGKT